MHKNIAFLVFTIVGGLLAAFSLALAISFGVAYSSFVAGGEAFRASLYLDLLITLIVFNSLYFIALGVYLGLRYLKKRK